jgi:hypothetical protein
LRRRLWELSSLERVRACGRVARTPDGGAVLRLSGEEGQRTGGFAGLVSCGSPWACPTCARKIGARRAQEIRDLVDAVHAAGGACALITLTLRHHRRQPLVDLWTALNAAWSRVTSARRYRAECEQHGVEGWVRAVEVTRGEGSGWHPHAHLLVILDGPISQERLDELAGAWHDRFARALARRGHESLADHGGLDARLVQADDGAGGALGTYLSKIAREVTGGMIKDGRRGSRSPFAILRDGLATGLADDLEAWWEFERASHGRRQVTWSRGIRDRYRLAAEETDAEIAEHDLGGEDVLVLPGETWRAVRDAAEVLLAVAEDEGPAGAARWLRARGLVWTWARSAPRREPVGT